MTKIGILTCSNSTQDAGCCSAGCLMEQQAGKGRFAEYKANGGSTLMGIISCAGCPTMAAPEKILSRVKMLAGMGVEKLHFSTCLTAVCPFREKYRMLIEEKNPQLKVVLGSHGSPDRDAVLIPAFQQGIKKVLGQNTYDMMDLMEDLQKQAPQ